MFELSRQNLRFRWPSFLATFIAMFFSAVMLVAAGGLLETAMRDVVPPQRLAAASVVVTGDATYPLPNNPVATLSERVPLPVSLVPAVAAVPGVARAVPDLQFPASVVRNGTVVDDDSFGHGWSSAQLRPYHLMAGTAPSGRGDVVLDAGTATAAGVQVGGTIPVSVRGQQASYRVTGIVAPSGRATTAAVFFTDAAASQLSGRPDVVDSIGVLAQPGTTPAVLTQRIAAALDGKPASLLTGNERGRGEFPGLSVTDLTLIGYLLAGLSLVIAVLGVASALSLSLQDRDRELATLRSVGATPRQLRRLIVGEALTVGLLAIVLAAGPGVLFSRWLFDTIVGTGIAPAELAFRFSWPPIAAAAGFLLLACLAAASIAGRRATRSRPIEALAGTARPSRRARWIRGGLAVLAFGYSAGLVFVALNLVTGPFIAGPAVWASILFILGLWLLAPIVVRLLLVPLTAILRAITGTSGYLASLNAQAGIPRIVAVVGPLMLLTGIGVSSIYVTTTEAQVHAIYTDGYRHDVVLRSGQDGFAPDALTAVRNTPGVAAASEFVTSAGYVETPKDPWLGRDLAGWTLQGVTAGSAAAVGVGPVSAGSLSQLTGNTVALASTHAKALGRGVGDTITMRLGDGAKVDLKVVALVAMKPSFESIVLPAQLLAAHVTAQLPNYILAAPEPGVPAATLNAALAPITAAHPGSTLGDRNDLTPAFHHHLNAQTLVMNLFAVIIMGFIAITVINSLALSTITRRREFGLQRLAGSTDGQVLRMTAMEAGLAAAIAVILATVAAPITLIPFSRARSGSWLPTGPVWIYFAVMGFAIVVTLVATLVPTYRALRHPPMEAALSAA